MINRFFFLFSALVFLIGSTSSGIASGSFPTHTQYTPELEPASILELGNSYQIASVCFLGVGGCDEKQNYDVDSANQCRQEGYIKNNCNSVQVADTFCPYNSSYIRGCKCKSGLISCPSGQVGVGDSCGGKYASCKCDPNLKTCASNQVGSGASCGGKYQTCTCKPEYQFTSSNCSSPRSVSGASCGGKYNSCVCPKGVSTGAYGCKEYYPSPCSSVCKIAYSDNCHKRTSVQTPYGCMSYFADCSSKCERAYPDNCRNRTAVSAPHGCQQMWTDCTSKCQIAYGDNCRNRTAVSTHYGCQQAWADCGSKCQIAYPDNCRNRTAVSTPYGCQQAWADCGSKCQIAYPDNCRNRTAVSTPYGCQQAWADCGSKCQIAYPDNCRNRTAVSAPYGCQQVWADCKSKCQIADKPMCKIGYIYYTDGTCVAPENHTSSKQALGIVAYVTDGGRHGQIMATKYIGSDMWKSDTQAAIYDTIIRKQTGKSGNVVDVPDLKNYTSEEEVARDFNSCDNTNKIMNYAKYFEALFKERNSSLTNPHNPTLLSMFPAAEMAKKYAPTSATKGKWCLPAAGVLKNILNNKDTINVALAKLNGEKLFICHAKKVYHGEYDYSNTCSYWSSNEYHFDIDWYVYSNALSSIISNAYYGRFIWPVLEF